MMQDAHLDLLKETVRNTEKEKYEDVIWKSKDYSLFYHLSAARRNLLEWIPLRAGTTILEVGAECGALTGLFLEKGNEVTALEADPAKAEILKLRYKDCANLQVVTGTFSDLPEGKTWDYLISAGSLPLAATYFPKEADPYLAFLRAMRARMADDARVFVSLPNKLGLKYLSGAREDYTGAPFTGIENYFYHPSIRTFGRRELAGLFDQAGFPGGSWFYPYPDWRFPVALFSDERLPRTGELNRNLESCDQERYVFFDETKAFDTLVEEGLFSEFANSFLVVFGMDKTALPTYIKYASERSKKYALRTEQRWNGIMRKVAMFPEGIPHIRSIFSSYEILEHSMKDTMIRVAPCRLVDNALEQKYVQGRSLQQFMQKLALEGKNEEIQMLITEYLMRLETFENLNDIDLIFSNLMISSSASTALDVKHSVWDLIDYEWTYEEPKPKKYVLYRSFLMASAEITNCEALKFDNLIKRINLSKDQIKQYENQEKAFQAEVLGERHPTRDMVRQIEPGIIPLATLDQAYRASLVKPEEKKRRFFRL